MKGHNIVLNPNQANLAVKDEAKFSASVVANDNEQVEVEYNKRPNVYILGVKWTAKKK
jgi:hypothetical protein